MKQKKLENNLGDNKLLETKAEIIAYLKKIGIDINKVDYNTQDSPYSESLATIDDFIPIAWDTPY